MVTKEKDVDLMMDHFDFDIFGETISDISGIKIAKTSFPNQGSRIQTRNAIL